MLSKIKREVKKEEITLCPVARSTGKSFRGEFDWEL